MRTVQIVLATLCFMTGCIKGHAATPPNFVVILADDLGYGDVSYQGGDLPTPNIDSIARSGVIFTDGYVTCPVCAPSRAGLLTGKYQQTFGFWDNIGPYRVNEDTVPGIPADLPILSERLKKLGYTCGLFGKTHDGSAEELMAFNRWDEFYGFNNGASNFLKDMNPTHNPIFHNKKIVSNPYEDRNIDKKEVCVNGVIVKDADQYLTDELGTMACRFIEENKERPFLCYIPFNAVHGPFQAPKELADKYSDAETKDRQMVMAMLESMDTNIGRVLETLRNNDLTKNTMVIFLSDNGGHHASPSKPLRGKKGTYWEGGLRVPFCMQWPGKIKQGTTFSHPVISLDIMPTLIHAAGGNVESSWELDGVDLMPYLSGKDKNRPHRTLTWIWGARRAIREGDLKAVTMDNGQQWELFDLARDMEETTDLAGKYPEKLEALINKHDAWCEDLIPQQWGWNKKLGYKDPLFGKPRSYHKRK